MSMTSRAVLGEGVIVVVVWGSWFEDCWFGWGRDF